jgi:hypothetical protein
MSYGCEVWERARWAAGRLLISSGAVNDAPQHEVFFGGPVALRALWLVPAAVLYCLHRMHVFLDIVCLLWTAVSMPRQPCQPLWVQVVAGANHNWFSKLTKLLTHVYGGTLPEDTLHTDGVPYTNVDKCLTLWRKHQHTDSMEEPVCLFTHSTQCQCHPRAVHLHCAVCLPSPK